VGASEVADLWVKLSLLSTGFTEGLEEAGAEADGFSGRMGKVGSGLLTLGKYATEAGLGVAAVSVKMAGDWQASMIKLTTSAGETGTVINGKLTGEIAKVSDGLLQMSVKTATSTKNLSDAMYYVESAGFHGADGLKVMSAAAEGAKAENADTTTVADALTTALHDMGMGANQSVPMMNMMIRAVADGKMSMQDFSSSLHAVLPQAHAAGISFQDAAGALATMTVSGTTAEQAANNLGHTISSLQSPNAVAVKAMATFGLSTVDLKEKLGQRGLLGTMGLIDKAILDHMGPDGLALQNTFNKSQVAAQDLNQMLGVMPPQLKSLAEQVMNNTISTKDFNTATNDMTPNLKAQGSEFLTLYKNSNSFNQSLRNGVPGADTFAGSLRKVLGDTVDTNTALQIGGLNLQTFADNEANIAAGAKNAGANIETWGTITAGFNFKIDQARQILATTAIKIGEDLIPKLTDLMDLAGSKGGPLLVEFGDKLRNAFDSPEVHSAENVLLETWRNLIAFSKDAITALSNMQTVLQPLAGQLAIGFFGALKAVGDILKNVVGPALMLTSDFFKSNSTIIKDLADVALAALITKLVYTKALLAIDMFGAFIGGIGTAATALFNFGNAVGSGKIFDTIRLKAMYASDALKGFAVSEGEAGTAAAVAGSEAEVGGFASKLGTLVGTGALIGGVVLGLGMVANWLSKVGQKSVDATAEMNQMTSELLDIAHTGSAANTQMAQFAITATQHSSMKMLFDIVDESLAKLVQSGNLTAAQDDIAAIDTQLKAAGLSTDAFHNSLTRFSDAAGQYVNQQREAASATQDSAFATQQATDATDASTSSMDGLTNSVNNAFDAQQKMSNGLEASRALDDFNRAVQNVTTSLNENGTAITGNSTAAMNNRDALRQAAQAIVDNYNAQVQLNGDTAGATQKLHDQINELENQKGMTQQTKDAIKAYIDQLNLIPTNVTTTVTANTGAALAAVNSLQAKVNRLASLNGDSTSSLPTPAAPSQSGNSHLKAYGLGGYVDGPKGAPQLAIVHGGEYVLSNDMLDASGGGSAAAGAPMGGVVNNYFTIQGSVLAEQDLRNLVQSQMLQLGGRRSQTYAPYQR
jgi:TP901 family phage tail tape measure protein